MMARATTAAGKLATSALVEPARTLSEGMTCFRVLRPKDHNAMRLMVSNDHQRAYPATCTASFTVFPHFQMIR